MGIKKISKRLAKVGRKASERLGEGGKKWVEAVFETAIGVIEEELRKKTAKPARTPAAGPAAPPRKPAAPAARKAVAMPRKKVTTPAKKKTSTSGRRPARAAATTRAAPEVADAPADPPLRSDRREDELLS